MASIIVSGDVSGACTITAPAIAGTTTLTLPTTSGTILTTAGGQTVPFAAGSAASPSITFTGDTNTGIFSPAADSIAFTEGGVESMRIDSSGNVGIGTITTNQKLTVFGNTLLGTTSYAVSPATTLTVADGSAAVVQVHAAYPSASNQSTIQFSQVDGNSNTYITSSIVGKNLGNGGYGGLLFNTMNNNSLAERMRIDNNGNVGIGTSSPSFPLDVAGAIRGNSWIARANTSVPSADAAIYRPADNTLGFSTAQTERMRIDSSGNVLTGGLTSSPGQADPNSTAGQIVALNTKRELRWNNTNASIYGGSGGADDNLYYYSGLSHIFRAASAERMRLTSGGELLINRTGTLNARLGITSSSGACSINCGDEADSSDYGIVQIVRNQNQPDNKFHLSFIRGGIRVAGMGFLRNSSTLAVMNTGNTTGSGVGLTADATSWSTVSDERKKDIIAPVENALTKLADWRSVYYKYKTDKEDAPQRVGLIAQDVQATLPEAVSAEEDELQTLQVRYTETIPLLVKAIQELNIKVEAQAAEIAALKGAN